MHLPYKKTCENKTLTSILTKESLDSKKCENSSPALPPPRQTSQSLPLEL